MAKDLPSERELQVLGWWEASSDEANVQSECAKCSHKCFPMQIPTEDFFTNQFGLPLTMNPNFEDLSCEMIFGQRAPPLEQEEIYNQPCFAHECKIGDREPTACPKIDTERRVGQTQEGVLRQ